MPQKCKKGCLEHRYHCAKCYFPLTYSPANYASRPEDIVNWCENCNLKIEEKCKKHGVVHKNGGYKSCYYEEQKPITHLEHLKKLFLTYIKSDDRDMAEGALEVLLSLEYKRGLSTGYENRFDEKQPSNITTLQSEIYCLMDSFLVESKDQNGNERSIERLNRDRHIFVKNMEEIIERERRRGYCEHCHSEGCNTGNGCKLKQK